MESIQMNIVKPICLIYQNKVIIYDVVVSTHKKMIALIINPNYVSQEEINKIQVTQLINGSSVETKLIAQEVQGLRTTASERKKTDEGAGILYYAHLSDKVNIKFENITINVVLSNKQDELFEKNDVIISTLIHRPTYHCLRDWLVYHKSKNLNNFVIYVNDFCEQNKKVLEQQIQNLDMTIVFIEWNFDWYPSTPIGKFHGAQCQSLNHCIHFFNAEKFIFIDVDEYLDGNVSIFEIFNLYKDYGYITLKNKWCFKIDLNAPTYVSPHYMYDSIDDNVRIKSIVVNKNLIQHVFVHGCLSTGSQELINENLHHFKHIMNVGCHADRLNHLKLTNKRIVSF
jgi:hypothetical protein